MTVDIFPPHKCGLYLTHNQHKDYHEPLERYLVDQGFDEDSWATEYSKAAALAADELWDLQWYPNTPIGFYRIIGATLEEVLTAAKGVRE